MLKNQPEVSAIIIVGLAVLLLGNASLYFLTPDMRTYFATEGIQRCITTHPGYRSLAEHAPIHIGDNSMFTFGNGVQSGDGSADNPYIISGWHINSGSDGYCIYVHDTTAHFIIKDCVLEVSNSSENSYGISIQGLKNGIVENNTVTGGTEGINVGSCSAVQIIENDIFWSQGYGLGIYGSSNITAVGNNISNSDLSGINLIGSSLSTLTGNNCSYARTFSGINTDSSYNNLIENNTCSYNSVAGIVMQHSHGQLLIDNYCHNNNFNGIELDHSPNNTISGNVCENNRIGGIDVDYADSNGNIIKNNTCQFNGANGIDIYTADMLTITNNTLKGNYHGVNIYASKVNITYNYLKNNIKMGVSLTDCNGCIVTGNNFIENNKSGVQAFDNGNNQWDMNGRGNFWSDYTLRYPDAQAETDVYSIPYEVNGGMSRDRYPLIQTPGDREGPHIEDGTNGSPSTGMPFTLTAQAYDDIYVRSVSAHVWYDDGTSTNMSMNMEEDGTWSITVDIPENAFVLYYTLTAEDGAGKHSNITHSREVIDTIPPTADAGGDITCFEGEQIILNGSGSKDNRGISNWTWSFYLNGSQILYYGKTVSIMIPTAGIYQITLTVSDGSGNNDSDGLNVTVKKKDVNGPIIDILNYATEINVSKTTYILASVWDYSSVKAVWLEYTDVDGEQNNVTMKQDGHIWNGTVEGQNHSGTITFFVSAVDNLGNWNRTNTLNINVINESVATKKERPFVNRSKLITSDNLYIYLNFSAPMDRDSVNASISIRPDMMFSVNWSGPSTLLLKFQSESNTITTYTLRINSSALDIFGNELIPFILIFTLPPQISEKSNNSGNEGNHSEPTAIDSDGDGMPDVWEESNGLNISVNDADGDPDGDNLTNLAEYLNHTNPNLADTDGDGMPDGWEVMNGLMPDTPDGAVDIDGDGLSNLAEYLNGTLPTVKDTDGDGISDGWEVYYGTSATYPDSNLDPDGDSFTNLEEYENGTDPQNRNDHPDNNTLANRTPGCDRTYGYIIAVFTIILTAIVITLVIMYVLKNKSNK